MRDCNIIHSLKSLSQTANELTHKTVQLNVCMTHLSRSHLANCLLCALCVFGVCMRQNETSLELEAGAI